MPSPIVKVDMEAKEMLDKMAKGYHGGIKQAASEAIKWYYRQYYDNDKARIHIRSTQ